MDAQPQPNMVIDRLAPPKPRPPGAPRVPHAVLIGLLASFVVFGVLTLVAVLWSDPEPGPPYDTTLAEDVLFFVWILSPLAFVGFGLVAVSMLVEARRTRPALEAKTIEVTELRASRGRLVDASDAARREIERDLHDGVQPRVVALLLNVSMARRAGQFDGAPAVINDIEHELGEILREIRALASGILPPALTDLGLEAAVTELTALMPFRVDLSLPRERLPARAEVTAYFVIAEALTNAAKHADPSRVSVRVDVRGQRASVEVHDDRCGGVDASAGTGLLGLADRIDTLDGRLTVASALGAGTTVTAEFSCAS
jgi:signal transduction histidine kinase